MADEMMPDIVGQWRGNFRSAYGSADRLGLGQYQTKDHDSSAKKSKLSFWPFNRDQKSPEALPEPERVSVENRNNGSKPPEENPT